MTTTPITRREYRTMVLPVLTILDRIEAERAERDDDPWADSRDVQRADAQARLAR